LDKSENSRPLWEVAWNSERHARFSSVEPDLPISDDFHTANVAAQSQRPSSWLAFYRELRRMRRQHSAFVRKGFDFVASNDSVLAFRRWHEGTSAHVVLNFHSETRDQRLAPDSPMKILLSTGADRTGEECMITLRCAAKRA
jgi:alpha-glucosidase